MINKDLIEKAKRRIKRSISTGEKVHRVRQISEKRYDYDVKHNFSDDTLHFRADKLGRLALI